MLRKKQLNTQSRLGYDCAVFMLVNTFRLEYRTAPKVFAYEVAHNFVRFERADFLLFAVFVIQTQIQSVFLNHNIFRTPHESGRTCFMLVNFVLMID